MRRGHGSATVSVSLTLVCLTVMLALAGCGSAPAGRRAERVAHRASRAAAQRFVNRAERALHGRFSATYRISLPNRLSPPRRIFHGQVLISQLAWNQLRFRETPAFTTYGTRNHAYEVLERRSGYVNCTQPRANGGWSCVSEAGEGMGGMAAQNGAVAPQAFTLGLSNAVAGYTRGPLFLSRRTLDARSLRCLDFGNAAGRVGQVCTTASGFVVSYRLPERLTYSVYATAQLTRYSPKVDLGVLRPPAKPVLPGA